MSSAALQNQPTPLAALSTPPLAPSSPTNPHFSSSHSSPREVYHAQPQSSGASPSSSRRPSRQHSNGVTASPTGHNSPMSSRAALSSPTPVAGPSAERPSTSERRRDRNMAAAVPPRTSSTQHGSGGASSSRRAAHGAERGSDSPRRTHHDANGTAEDDAAAQSSRSRRHQLAQEPPPRTSSNTASRAASSSASLPSKPQQPAATASSSKGVSREASEILNSVLISQPEVDIAREKERLAMAQAFPDDDPATPPVVSPVEQTEEARRGGRSRHDHSKREKHTKFGEYILGNTIGEGEFGKVKLGWKQEGGVQVAIKLIKKDQLGSNPSRMAKIMREVAILKSLTHPNIVRLHKMEESERHYGIVLEYASGGELFDYILNHRYLKDNAARRLFAQLVSGVGYLHKKGIVHRDLKLENLLLDRNRNIIITDFGFANNFDPHEDLTEEEESNLSDREWVKRMGLDKVKSNGWRKGDLMQTSCGSPCYAAPELVVSDSLYTGRKVDVWSCGVILYAMLAGYLPFDDDPANPEGDNINLLYKYIVNTPLTFPEYVTPHARDLLRRILVPNPRKRADLFEVARHSWLSEYAHVVEMITSSTTTPGDIQNATVPAEDEAPFLNRSASVRESSKKAIVSPTFGGLATKQGNIDPENEAAHARQHKDSKRRTVQVEYVAPTTQTQRGEPSGSRPPSGKTRARSGSHGPVEVAQSSPASQQEKPLPRDPPVSKDAFGKASVGSRRPPSSHHNNSSTRRTSEATRALVDGGAAGGGSRPETGASMQSAGSRGAGGRASYGQPLSPAVAGTNVHGRISQPSKGGSKNYNISNPIPIEQPPMDWGGRPSVSIPPKFARVSGFAGDGTAADVKTHKRSSTIGDFGGKIFGRSGSIFGGRSRKKSEQHQQAPGEKGKKYPPVSMNNSMHGGEEPRSSMDSKPSRRSFSIGLGKNRSGSFSGSQTSQEKPPRRFSLIPGFSLKAIGIGKEPYDHHRDRSPHGRPRHEEAQTDSQQDLPIQEPPQVDRYGRYLVDQSADAAPVDVSTLDGMYAQLQDPQQRAAGSTRQQHGASAGAGGQQQPASAVPSYMPAAVLNTGSSTESSFDNSRAARPAPAPRTGSLPHHNYQHERYARRESHEAAAAAGRGTTAALSPGAPAGPGAEARAEMRAARQRGVLQKNKRFVDAWDTDESGSRQHDHSGSSGPARKVMDFFRRRGKARGGEA